MRKTTKKRADISKSKPKVEESKKLIINDRVLLFKIGSDDRPASTADIKDFEQLVNKALDGKIEIPIITTHHSVSVEILHLKAKPKLY